MLLLGIITCTNAAVPRLAGGVTNTKQPFSTTLLGLNNVNALNCTIQCPNKKNNACKDSETNKARHAHADGRYSGGNETDSLPDFSLNSFCHFSKSAFARRDSLLGPKKLEI